jgi:predicted metal-dependent HD superfamily phosphohydrolase
MKDKGVYPRGHKLPFCNPAWLSLAYKDKNTMLKETFLKLCAAYTKANSVAEKCWQEIEVRYSAPGRYYHTLEHLAYMMVQLEAVRQEVKDWNAVLFSLYYHDAVYDVTAKDNEVQSALFAAEQMQALDVPLSVIEKSGFQILATEKHHTVAGPDTNLFTDVDLAILGSEPVVYKEYSKKIREEYKVFPDPVYNPGRKAVLLHFLETARIFKTAYFFERFEMQARQNLQQECDGLQGLIVTG